MAQFIVTSENGIFQFTDASILDQGDEITSRLWRFGDGGTSVQENPSYMYSTPGSYECIYQIATEQGCNAADTMLIEICSIGLDFNLGNVCNEDGNVALALTVTDIFNSLQFIDVYLDDQIANDTAIDISQGIVNLNLMVPGDGNQHVVRVESALSNGCSESIGFIVEDCNSSCFLSELEIDESISGSHNIVLTEGGFVPSNRIIELGELVRFIWRDDNHSSTSVDTISNDRWDSGVQDSSFTLELDLKIPGIKPYYSTPDGGPDGPYSGNIIANCPTEQGSLVELTFLNSFIPETGFYIGLDGVILKDTVYEYSNNGLTKVLFFLPGDGKSHQMSVVDVEDPSCSLSKTVRAINCQGELDCAINVDAVITERCDQDSMVQIAVAVNSLKPTDQGVVVILDDSLVMDTIFFVNNQASTIITLFGDGLVHSISAFDLSDSLCTDELFIEVNDCSAPCSISNLDVGTGSNNTIVLGVTNDKISLKDIVIASGDDILWQWVEDSIVGLRSEAISGPDSWDSGLSGNGAIFLSPILTAGLHPYFLYNSAGDTLFRASIEVVAACEENMIPVFYEFDDVNGSFTGYNIFVDGVPLPNGPFDYALDGDNRGTFQLEGDDMEHDIEIRDAEDENCSENTTFVAPTCEVTPCGGMIELFVQDSCYNDNTVRYVAKISHPDPNPQGFIFEVNGELFPDFPFEYDENGEAFFEGFVSADSSIHIFSYRDLFDPNCFDTLLYQSPVCVTDCELTHLSTQLIDDDYLAQNPNFPDSLAGCIDSFINVEVRFFEKYSNSDNYFVFLDDILVNSIYNYNSGDTVNSFILNIIGDDSLHLIEVFDALDSMCMFATEIQTPLCYSPCNITIDEIVADSCSNEIAYYTVNLASSTNSIGYQVFYDGDSLDIEADSLSFSFNAPADGLAHTVLIIDDMEPLCRDSIEFIAEYCLDCNLDISVMVLDSCEIGDSIGYSLNFDPGIDSIDILVETGDTSFAINPISLDFEYQIRLRGDSSAYQYIFTSLEDQFCKDTIDIQTIDCTPIICEPNFTFSIEGLTITLTDSSTTSEPIIGQEWTINDIISVEDLSTFNYTFDSIGVYEVCHAITTDSCSSEICLDIEVGDPCTLITAFYTTTIEENGVQFNNQSTGNIDSYLYNFGDGIFSNNPNPFHIYDESGVYEACLIVRQDEFDCEVIYCDSIEIVISSTTSINHDDKVTVFPNPVKSGEINQFYLQIDQQIERKPGVKMLNPSGQLVKINNLTSLNGNRYLIDLADEVSPGIYFMEISLGTERIVKKIVVF